METRNVALHIGVQIEMDGSQIPGKKYM